MHKQLSEKDIEQYLAKKVKAMGGRAYKFVSPGNDGVPDRLVCLPGGKLCFVELKAPGKKTTALQDIQISRLISMGFAVYVADSKELVDTLLEVVM